ncbi:hypothetical protein Tco_0266210 [Tanacetum coccineum]
MEQLILLMVLQLLALKLLLLTQQQLINLSVVVVAICAFFCKSTKQIQGKTRNKNREHMKGCASGDNTSNACPLVLFMMVLVMIGVIKQKKSVYEEDIKVLKREIHLREVAITELRRKLELAQKQKFKIQLSVENFENSSKNLSKLIDCQIVDKCKTGLGYNVVPPPYTGNFMPPKPDLSFSSLEEFTSNPIVIKLVVENSKAKASEAKPKAVRKKLMVLKFIED